MHELPHLPGSQVFLHLCFLHLFSVQFYPVRDNGKQVEVNFISCVAEDRDLVTLTQLHTKIHTYPHH